MNTTYNSLIDKTVYQLKQKGSSVNDPIKF